MAACNRANRATAFRAHPHYKSINFTWHAMSLITIQGGWKWGTYEKTLARVSSPGAKFRCAAKGLDLETMRAYIRDGVDVNERSSKGVSALKAVLESMIFVTRRIEEVVIQRPDGEWFRVSAEKCAEPRRRTTLLADFVATEEAGLMCARELLAAGADLDFYLSNGDHNNIKTGGALKTIMASKLSFRTASACITLLIRAGADPNTALESASKSHVRFVPVLLRAGASIPQNVRRHVLDARGIAPARSADYLERVRATGGYGPYETMQRDRLMNVLKIILKRLPQRALAAIVYFSTIPGARGLELDASDRPEDIVSICRRVPVSPDPPVEPGDWRCRCQVINKAAVRNCSACRSLKRRTCERVY